MVRRRVVGRVSAVGLAALVVAACGGTTPAEDVAPEIERTCDDLRSALVTLAETRTDPPSIDDVRTFQDAFFDAFDTLSDEDTTAGRPNSVVGSPIQRIRRALLRLEGAYNGRDLDADLSGVISEVDAGLIDLNAGADDFGVPGCLDGDAVAADVAVLVGGYESVVGGLRPTGDFTVDFAAACGRYREDIADLLLDSFSDPTFDAVGPTQTADVMNRFAADLANVVPPDELRNEFDTVVAALEEASSSALGIGQARLASQEAADEAVARFAAAEENLNIAIAAIDAGC